MTSERERETLDLLLVTILSPAQILWPKLISGLRVSSVLTMFLLWPLVLAVVMVPNYWTQLHVVAGYLAIVLVSCLTTATVALFCSVVLHKTSVSLITTYLVILLLFTLPLAVSYFATSYFPTSEATATIVRFTFSSPFATAFALPLDGGQSATVEATPDWLFFGCFLAFYAVLDGLLMLGMNKLFNSRWRMDN